jgi:hypothetical protein
VEAEVEMVTEAEAETNNDNCSFKFSNCKTFVNIYADSSLSDNLKNNSFYNTESIGHYVHQHSINKLCSSSNVDQGYSSTECEISKDNLSYASDFVNCSKNLSVLNVNARPFVIKTSGSLSACEGIDFGNNSVFNSDFIIDGDLNDNTSEDIDGFFPSPCNSIEVDHYHARVSAYTSTIDNCVLFGHDDLKYKPIECYDDLKYKPIECFDNHSCNVDFTFNLHHGNVPACTHAYL